MPSEDDRPDAPVHQESQADRDLYAAARDITINNYHYPQGASAQSGAQGIAGSTPQDAFDADRAGGPANTAEENGPAGVKGGPAHGSSATGQAEPPDANRRISEALQAPLAILGLATALLALQWTLFRVASILALTIAGTSLWVRLRQGRRWSDRSVVTTTIICVTACAVLAATFVWHANSPPSKVKLGTTGLPSPTPVNSTVEPSPPATRTLPVTPSATRGTSPPSRTIKGPWSQPDGLLTLVISEVELSSGMLQLRMKAINNSSEAFGLPLYGNFTATDNSGDTFTADTSTSNWTANVPSGGFITGTIYLVGTLSAGAKTMDVSFDDLYAEGFYMPPTSGITVHGISIPG